MMFGGFIMMLVGLFFLLIMIGLPIILIVAAVTGGWGFLRSRVDSTADSPKVYSIAALPLAKGKNCSHCGHELQDDWIDCLSCGAPIGN